MVVEQLKVFISYSRTDSDFRERLAASLEENRFHVVFDVQDNDTSDPELTLTPQDKWWDQLKSMIAACDVVVFIVSPASSQSRVCDDEIAHAQNLGKRIIPILWQALDIHTAPERLRSLNIDLDFRADRDKPFDEAFPALIHELNRDVHWEREGSFFARLADRWHQNNRSEGLLLRSETIQAYDSWVFRRPAWAPEPGTLISEFIHSSREFEAKLREQTKQLISNAHIEPVNTSISNGHFDRAIRFAASAMLAADDLELEFGDELWRCSARAMLEDTTLAVFHGRGSVIEKIGITHDLLFSHDMSGHINVWDIESGRIISRTKFDKSKDKDSLRSRWLHIAEDLSKSEPESLNEVTSSDYASSGDYVLQTDSQGNQCITNVKTGGLVSTLPVDRPNLRLIGELLDTLSFVLVGDSRVFIFDTLQQKIVSEKQVVFEKNSESIEEERWRQNRIEQAGIMRGGKELLIVDLFGTIKVFDLGTEEVTETIQTDATSPGGVLIPQNGPDFFVVFFDSVIWRSPDSEKLHTFGGASSLRNGLSVSDDGTEVALGTKDGDVIIVSCATGQIIETYRGHQRPVLDVLYDPEGPYIWSASEDGTIRKWARYHDRLHVSIEAGGLISNTQILPESSNIVYRSHAHHYLLFSIKSNEWFSMGGEVEKAASAIGVDAKSEHVITASNDGFVRIWTQNGDLDTIIDTQVSDTILTVGISTSSDSLYIKTKNLARFYSIGSKEITHEWKLEENDKIHAMFENGVFVVNSTFHKIYEYSDFTLSGVEAVDIPAVSHDGKLLVARCRYAGEQADRVTLFDFITGEKILHFGDYKHPIWQLTFSPCSRYVYARQYTGVSRILRQSDVDPFANSDEIICWSVESGERQVTFKGHTDAIFGMAVSQNGRWLSSSSNDGTIRIWETSSGAEVLRLPGKRYTRLLKWMDGDSLLISSSDGDQYGTQVWCLKELLSWPVSRRARIADRLACGRGHILLDERSHPLLKDSPTDLHEALGVRSNDLDQVENLARQTEVRAIEPER
nr:TIR domain-containing protein [Hyphomonas sp. Mor2]